jgi:hypothetical protein
MLSFLLGLASFNTFSLGLVVNGVLFGIVALLFLCAGAGIYGNKQWTLSFSKVFCIVWGILLIVGAVLLTLKAMGNRRGFWESADIPIIIVLRCFVLLSISFIFSLEKQMKIEKKTTTAPRRIGLSAFVSLVVVLVAYFSIGRWLQQVPEIADTYFDKIREDPDLPEEDNGYEQLKKLIGSNDNELTDEQMEKYPFVYRNQEMESTTSSTNAGMTELGNRTIIYKGTISPTSPEYVQAPLQWQWYESLHSSGHYASFVDLLSAHPALRDEQKVHILENSDFFYRLTEIVEMERYNHDYFFSHILSSLQSLERVMSRLVAYYADNGDLETAVKLNILALKLGDKFFSTYHSLVDGMSAVVNLRISADTTQYLLTYELSPAQKSALLATYQSILTESPEIATKNLFIGDYRSMMDLTHGFTPTAPEGVEMVGLGGSNILLSITNTIPLLMYRFPFSDTPLTIAKYQYAMAHAQETNKSEESEKAVWKTIGFTFDETSDFHLLQPRNLYNLMGNLSLQGFIPRFRGAEMLNVLYQEKEFIISTLEARLSSEAPL